jgi:hypothetical protein
MTRPAARFAAGIAVVVTAMVGGCAPNRPPATIDLDQARLVSIIRNTASAEYESVWSGVPFVAQSERGGRRGPSIRPTSLYRRHRRRQQRK